MWEILLLEFRTSHTSENSQVKNQKEVTVGSFHTEADPQEVSDNRRMCKHALVTGNHGSPIRLGVSVQKLSEQVIQIFVDNVRRNEE